MDQTNVSSSKEQVQSNLCGNEQQEKDVFIDIDPPQNAQMLLVRDEQTNTSDTQTQVAASATTSASDSDLSDLLPPTLTKLTTRNGSEVFLIGTAHFSHKSIQDVQRIMRTIRPSGVVLELCKDRAFMLTLDERSLLEQNKTLSFESVRRAIAEKGLAQGLIYVTLVKMSANLTEKLGMAPGGEFRAASSEALKIPNCTVALGDRSLKVSVARAVASVSFWQKVKLVFQAITSDVTITAEDVEKCKDKDILEQMLSELGGEYPGFKQVLLDERNIYLAHSIYTYALGSENSFGPQRIVAVVGIGHVGGIVEHWGKTKGDDIARLNELPKTSKTRRVVTKTIKYCSLALMFYVGYRVIIPSSIQDAIHGKLTGLSLGQLFNQSGLVIKSPQ